MTNTKDNFFKVLRVNYDELDGLIDQLNLDKEVTIKSIFPFSTGIFLEFLVTISKAMNYEDYYNNGFGNKYNKYEQ